MADYRRMYFVLCSAAAKAVDELQRKMDTKYAEQILEEALLAAEEIYIETENTIYEE